MVSNTKNVPTLRFKEFSGEWVNDKLGNLAEFFKGKGISKDDIDPSGHLPCIRYGELYTYYGELIDNPLSRTSVDIKETFLSHVNDVIIPASGESAIDIAKASCVLKDNIALGSDLNIIRSSLNGIFLSYYLNSTKKRDIARLSQGISVIHLYSSQLKLLSLSYPSIKEQQKIADFLSTVDKKIQQLKQKQQLLQQYKKGMMQKLFSQQIRFKDENGMDYPEWEYVLLESLLKESRVKGNKGDIAKKITVKLWGNGVFAKNDNIQGSENTQYFIRKSGQFIYSKLDFLNCAFGIIPKELDGYETTVDLPCFDIDKKINSIYLLEYVKQKSFYKKFGDTADGSRKAKRIHADVFLSFYIELPSLPEQQKIADFLSSIDKKIDAVNEQIGQMAQFKQGLLQQLFV